MSKSSSNFLWAVCYLSILTITAVTCAFLIGRVSMHKEIAKRDQIIAAYEGDFQVAMELSKKGGW